MSLNGTLVTAVNFGAPGVASTTVNGVTFDVGCGQPSQPSLFDPSRAPAGKHVLWAYCHVPSGSTVAMTDQIEAQIERFAPGFRDLILARHVAGPAWFEEYNANNVGGDIAGGANNGTQLIVRPALSWHPYRTPDPAIFLCSASTPPGAGVHGMCGAHAAGDALATVLR